MRGWIKPIVIGVGALLALGAAGLGGFAVHLNNRLNAAPPAISGEAAMPGADGVIEIVRDRYGVPHIFAGSDADLYRGLGYAHAQDRFVQMDLTRRAMQGRLAEVVGDRAIEMDARARIMGWSGAAQAQHDRLSPEAKAMLAAYTEGVNAALAAMPEPAEYALFFAKPAPWAPVDSLAVSLAMTDGLTGGGESERRMAMLKTVLSPEQLAHFMPATPDWAARSYASADLAAATQAGPTAAKPAPAPAPGRVGDVQGPGSNAWVVAGNRTGTGKPVLANDPHLPLAAPGPFYLSRLQGPDGPLIGASLPGAPMIVIGRTQHLAWGTTTHQVDAADETPLTDAMAVTETQDVIRVNMMGLFQREVAITIRRTAEGAVMEPRWWASDKSYKAAYGDTPVVIRTIANDPNNGVAEAVFRGAKAKTVEAYFAALQPWTAPPQNLVVADSAGAIGLISPGRFPARDAEGAWAGEIPQRLMAKNPASGYFATANNLQTPKDFGYPMPGGHDPYRVTLIDAALAKDSAHNAARAAALQTDLHALLPQRLASAIAQAAPKTDAGKAMQTALAAWDANAAADSTAATQFAYWLRALGKAVYGDELGETLFKEFQGPRELFLDGVANGALPAAWCDVKGSTPVETCAETFGAAMDEAAAVLVRERGSDPAGWGWGKAHAARFRNLVWSGLPLVGESFTVEVPFGGSGTSVNVARNWHVRDGYATVHAAGLRMVVDFADLNASQFMVAPGQSGHPRSPHYGDLAPLWAKGAYVQIRDDWGVDGAPDDANRLTLRPKS
jgi:penicillin amidase